MRLAHFIAIFTVTVTLKHVALERYSDTAEHFGTAWEHNIFCKACMQPLSYPASLYNWSLMLLFHFVAYILLPGRNSIARILCKALGFVQTRRFADQKIRSVSGGARGGGKGGR
jgi:hypothetical protein